MAGVDLHESQYLFRVMDPTGSTKEGESFALRLAPTSLERTNPVRGQVTQDFNGDISELDGGLGVSRMQLSGTHGVGPLTDEALAKTGGDSAGLKSLRDFHAFFVNWAEKNAARRSAGQALTRLKFSILGGGPTELTWSEWWIRPESIPSWTRSASNPLAWDWSMSFFLLGQVQDKVNRKATKAKGPTSFLDRIFGGALKPWDPNKSLIQNVQAMRTNAMVIQRTIQTYQSTAAGYVTGMSSAIRGLALSGNAVLRDTRSNVADVRGSVDSDRMAVRDGARNARYLAGSLRRVAKGERS